MVLADSWESFGGKVDQSAWPQKETNLVASFEQLNEAETSARLATHACKHSHEENPLMLEKIEVQEEGDSGRSNGMHHWFQQIYKLWAALVEWAWNSMFLRCWQSVIQRVGPDWVTELNWTGDQFTYQSIKRHRIDSELKCKNIEWMINLKIIVHFLSLNILINNHGIKILNI